MLSGKEIYELIKKDEDFSNEFPVEEMYEVTRSSIENLPNILNDFLDKPVTLENMFEVKKTILLHTLDNGDLRKRCLVTPKEKWVKWVAKSDNNEEYADSMVNFLKASMGMEAMIKVAMENFDDEKKKEVLIKIGVPVEYIGRPMVDLLNEKPFVLIRSENIGV